MTGEASTWLPIGVADRQVLREKVAEPLERWSRKWLAGVTLSVCRWEISTSGLWTDLAEHGRLMRKTVGVSCGDRGAMRLAAWLLDADLVDLVVTEGDRRITRALVDQALHDLIDHLEIALNLTTKLEPETSEPERDTGNRLGGVRVGVGADNGGVGFWVGLPLATVLPICEASLPDPPLAIEPLQSCVVALAQETVRLEATLGSVRLALSELQALACGDVLILDRALDEPLDLYHTDGDCRVARATITEADGWRALDLKSQESRTAP